MALAPGEYTLHEVEPPAGYLPADDIAFTVVDHETVQVDGEPVDAVTMVDKKKPEEEKPQDPGTDDGGENPKDDPTPKDPGTSGGTSGGNGGTSPKTGDEGAGSYPYIMLGSAAAAAALMIGKKRHDLSKKNK